MNPFKKVMFTNRFGGPAEIVLMELSDSEKQLYDDGDYAAVLRNLYFRSSPQTIAVSSGVSLLGSDGAPLASYQILDASSPCFVDNGTHLYMMPPVILTTPAP